MLTPITVSAGEGRVGPLHGTEGHPLMLFGCTRLALLALAAVVAGWAFADTFLTMVTKWYEDSAYAHGFLVVPIVAWLVWNKRAELAGTAARASWLGVPILLVCCAAWVIARGTGVLVLEQAAAVGALAALALTVLGPDVTRRLAVPIGFMFFAVPFGRALVPVLVQLTADFATAALQWSGVPVYRTYAHIVIPGGWFEVARACSGLGFVMTGLVLGVLYAHVLFRSRLKQLLCVAAFVVVPIVANGVRVYLTILTAHLTDMRFGPGVEHRTFGQIFFLLVLAVTILAAHHWREANVTAPGESVAGKSHSEPVAFTVRQSLPVLAALVILALTPQYLQVALRAAAMRTAEPQAMTALPPGAGDWLGPADADDVWRPLYQGSIEERAGRYRAQGGGTVDVFVAAYGLGSTGGAEMITYDHVLFAEEHVSVVATAVRRIALPSGKWLEVREVQVPHRGTVLLVWNWFLVGDRAATSEFVVKALEAAAFVLRTADFERIVTLATPLDDQARQRLQDFVAAHNDCVTAGLAAEACGG